MDLQVFVFALGVLFAHGGVINTDGGTLKRVARSPYCHVCEDSQQIDLPPPPPPPNHGPPGPPPPPPPPHHFRSHQWSGYSVNGNQHGVFSGASASEGAQGAGGAFSIASANAEVGGQAGSEASLGRGDLGEQQQQSSGFGSFNAASNKHFGGSGTQQANSQAASFAQSNSQQQLNFEDAHQSTGFGSNHIPSNSAGSSAQSTSSSASFSGNTQASGLAGGQSQQRLESGNFHSTSGFAGGQASQNLEQGHFQSNDQFSGQASGLQSQQLGTSGQFNTLHKGSESSGFTSSGSSAQSGYGGPRQLGVNGGVSGGYDGEVQQSSQGIQSTLHGALDLAREGLQTAQQTGSSGCSTCGRSSYALSNAKSNSGNAVAVSVGG